MEDAPLSSSLPLMDEKQLLSEWRQRRVQERRQNHTSLMNFVLATGTPNQQDRQLLCDVPPKHSRRAATSVDAYDSSNGEERSRRHRQHSRAKEELGCVRAFNEGEERLKGVRRDQAQRKAASQAYFERKLWKDTNHVALSLQRQREEKERRVEELMPSIGPSTTEGTDRTKQHKADERRNAPPPFVVTPVKLPRVHLKLYTVTPRSLRNKESAMLEQALRELDIGERHSSGTGESDALVVYDPRKSAVASRRRKGPNGTAAGKSVARREAANRASSRRLPPIDELLDVSNRVYESNQRCMGGQQTTQNPFGAFGNPPTYWERLQIYNLFVNASQ